MSEQTVDVDLPDDVEVTDVNLNDDGTVSVEYNKSEPKRQFEAIIEQNSFEATVERIGAYHMLVVLEHGFWLTSIARKQIEELGWHIVSVGNHPVSHRDNVVVKFAKDGHE